MTKIKHPKNKFERLKVARKHEKTKGTEDHSGAVWRKRKRAAYTEKETEDALRANDPVHSAEIIY